MSLNAIKFNGHNNRILDIAHRVAACTYEVCRYWVTALCVYVRSPITFTNFFFWLITRHPAIVRALVNYRLGHADFRCVFCIQLFIYCNRKTRSVVDITYLSIEETLFYKKPGEKYRIENVVTPNTRAFIWRNSQIMHLSCMHNRNFVFIALWTECCP